MTRFQRRAAGVLLAVVLLPWLTAESCDDAGSPADTGTPTVGSGVAPTNGGGSVTPTNGGDVVTTSRPVDPPGPGPKPQATGLTITQPPMTTTSKPPDSGGPSPTTTESP